MSEEKQICPKCGKEVNANEVFCGECGAQLKTEVKTQKDGKLNGFFKWFF